jgi:DNA-binding protein H-NS
VEQAQLMMPSCRMKLRRTVARNLRRLRQESGLTQEERSRKGVGAFVTSKPSTARPKRPVKYRDGQNEWTGVGTMPAWAKAKGDTLERFRV